MASTAISISEDNMPPPQDYKKEVHSSHFQEFRGPYKILRHPKTAGEVQGSMGQSLKYTGLPGCNAGQTQNPTVNLDGNQSCGNQEANSPEYHLVPGAPATPPYITPLASQNSQPYNSRHVVSRGRESFRQGSVLGRATTPPATPGGLKHASVPQPARQSNGSAPGPDLHSHSICAISDLQISNQCSAICKQASGKGPVLQADGPHQGFPDEVPLTGRIRILQRNTSRFDSDLCDLTGQEASDGVYIHSLTQEVSDPAYLAALETPDAENPITEIGQDMNNQTVPEGPIVSRNTYPDILKYSSSAGTHLPKEVGLADIRLHYNELLSATNLHGQVLQESLDCFHPTVANIELRDNANQLSQNLCSQATQQSPLLQNSESESSSLHGQVHQGGFDQDWGHSHHHHRNQYQPKCTTNRSPDLSCLATMPSPGVWNPFTWGGQDLKQATRESHTPHSSISGFTCDDHGHSTWGDLNQYNQATWSGSLLKSNALGSGPDLHDRVSQDCPDRCHQWPIGVNELSCCAFQSFPHFGQLSTQADGGVPSQVNKQGPKLHRNASVSYDDVWCYSRQDCNDVTLPNQVLQSNACGNGSDIPGKECQHGPNCHPCTICANSDLIDSVAVEEGPDHWKQQGQYYQLFPTKAGSYLFSHTTMTTPDIQDSHMLGGKNIVQQNPQESLILPSSASDSHYDMLNQTLWGVPDLLNPTTLTCHVQESSASGSASNIYDQVFKGCPDHCLCLVWGDSDHHQCATTSVFNPWDLSPGKGPDVPSLATQQGHILHSSAPVSCHDVSLRTTPGRLDLCNQAPDHVLLSISSRSQPDILECHSLAVLDVENSTNLSSPNLGIYGPGSQADIQGHIIAVHLDPQSWANLKKYILQCRTSSSTSNCNVPTTQTNPDQQCCYTMAAPNFQGFTPPGKPDFVNIAIPSGLLLHSSASMAGHDFYGCVPYVGQNPCHWEINPGQALCNSAFGSQNDGYHSNVCTGPDLKNWAMFPGHILHSNSSGSQPDVQDRPALVGPQHLNWAHLPCSVLWNSISGSHPYIWGQVTLQGKDLITLPNVPQNGAHLSQNDILSHATQAGLYPQNSVTLPDTVLSSRASSSTSDLNICTTQAGSDQNYCHMMADLEFPFPTASGAETLENLGTTSHPVFSRNASISNPYFHGHISCAGQDTHSRATTPGYILPNMEMRTDPNFYGCITQASPNTCIQANETVAQHGITSGEGLNLCRSTSIPHNSLPCYSFVPGADPCSSSNMTGPIYHHCEYPYQFPPQQYLLGSMPGPEFGGYTTSTTALHHSQDNPPIPTQGNQIIREWSSLHSQVNHQATPCNI